MNGFWNLERKWEEAFQQLKFNQIYAANDYFIKFHMSRLQCQVEIICCHFKIRANF